MKYQGIMFKGFSVVSDNSPLRIAMVDDDKDDIFLTKMAFKRASFPSEFIGLNSGKALFEYIKNNGIGSIDVLLLDLNMPVTNGHDILAELSAFPFYSDLCTIMFSTSNRTIDKDVSKHLGATAFIVKPSTVEETEKFVQLVIEMIPEPKLAVAS